MTPRLPYSSFVSVFERTFDVVVCGAGLVGYAAARRLANDGCEVLLFEPSGDLLWEAGRALENEAAFTSLSAHNWVQWLGGLGFHQSGHWFDPAIAEIVTAQELVNASPGFSTLLYAVPIAAGFKNGRLDSINLATKGGLRSLRARHWVDATEVGLLAKISRPEQGAKARAPKSLFRSLIVQSLHPEELDAAADRFLQAHSEIEWLGSHRATERRVRWAVGGVPWHREAVAILRELRGVVEGTDATFSVSQIALANYPVYSATAKIAETWPENLTVLSPVFRCEALGLPADRFELGWQGVDGSEMKPGAGRTSDAAVSNALVLRPIDSPSFEVIVAGAGTAGAIAAIAAGRRGCRTLAFDAAPYPGGVGTGGGISEYFYGASEGLQREVDLRAREMTTLLSGNPQTSPNAWHHDAKKIVLLEMFEEAGVSFLDSAMLSNVETTKDGRVEAVIIAKEGRVERIPASAFIDGTGDGDLCALAGVGSSTGRKGDGRTLAYSQPVFVLIEDGRNLAVRTSNFDSGWVDPTDPEDLSRARLEGIAQHFLPLQTGANRPFAVCPLLGIRQSRQIRTDVEITFSDLVKHARFDDAIGRTDTVADTHSVDFEFESDELAFYYWTCRSFWHRLTCQLPYRMLLPRGLSNVWIPCRAAGITPDAAYALRMQRDLQQLGEVAGEAAALCVSSGGGVARGIDFSALHAALGDVVADANETNHDDDPAVEALALLDRGTPGLHLWHLYQNPELYREELLARLKAPAATRTSFYAAVVLAMWGDERAEGRLIKALEEREIGLTHEDHPKGGAYGQCIDLPFWVQAVTFLRINGTARCLPALYSLALLPTIPLNVRTAVALTLERLVSRLGNADLIAKTLELLASTPVPDPVLPPSRSLWRKLNGEPQQKLGNDRGANTSQNHLWQLHLVIARSRKKMGLPMQNGCDAFYHDSRAFVRNAFRTIASPNHCR